MPYHTASGITWLPDSCCPRFIDRQVAGLWQTCGQGYHIKGKWLLSDIWCFTLHITLQSYNKISIYFNITICPWFVYILPTHTNHHTYSIIFPVNNNIHNNIYIHQQDYNIFLCEVCDLWMEINQASGDQSVWYHNGHSLWHHNGQWHC